jgi:ubiquinone/menaquinone biosynthesis C-methylase UbiE
VWQLQFPELLGSPSAALELGCGGAQKSIALARAQPSARVVGLDNSSVQLEAARSNVGEAGVEVELVHSSAESLPFTDASFDLVFCDHGAMSFAEPARTVPEVSRVLRPGGRLVFCCISDLMQLCYDDDTEKVEERLVHGFWERYRVVDDGIVSFHLPVGEWIRLFRANGLVVEDLIELRPEPGMTTTYEGWPYDWCRSWPGEHLWTVRKP